MQSNTSQIKVRILSALIATLVLTACSNKSTNSAQKDTLMVDVGAEGASIDPARAENGQEFRVVNDLFAGLIDFDQANRPIPGMAEKWEISSDGKTYTFHLRQGLKFSDGTAITAKDFVYSWQRLVDPKTAATYNFLLAGVVNADAIIKGKMPATSLGVAALDPQTFVVTLTHPMSEFLVYITSPGVFVVPQKTIEKYGQAWTEPQNIVTSGAYTLKEHVRNGYMLSLKNPNYYDASNVKIEKVKYFPYVDTNVGVSTYETGGLDTTWQNLPIDKFDSLKQKYGHELHVFIWERTNFLEFNMKSPKYADNLKLRQALSMAVDRQVITDKVLKSGQAPLYSIVTPTIENGKYADTKYDWASWSRDKQIEEAKKLYAEAGYDTSHPLNITLSYFTNDINKKTGLAIAAMWKQILGVNVTPTTQELKAWQMSGVKGDFDIRMSTWGADYNSVTTYTPIYQCGGGNNHSQYCNPAYDNLITQAGLSVDLTKQEQLYKEAIKVVNNDYPTIPLNEPAHQRLVKPRVQNYLIDTNYLDNVQSKWLTLSTANK